MKARSMNFIPAKLAIAALALVSASSGMMYQPFKNCTESSKVDSIQTLVWIDESMNPDMAPYRGDTKYAYHSGSCFLSQIVLKPSYMDGRFSANATLSADRRIQELVWRVEGDTTVLSRTTYWYSPAGDLDSSLNLSNRVGQDGVPVTTFAMDRYARTPQYQTIKSYFRRGTGEWNLYARDSIVSMGAITMVHSMDEEDSAVIACEYEGVDYACEPKKTNGNPVNLRRDVWHITAGRVDSLRSFDEQNRLISTDRYFWSSRVPGGIRRTRQAVASRPWRGSFLGGDFNLKGQRMISEPGLPRVIR